MLKEMVSGKRRYATGAYPAIHAYDGDVKEGWMSAEALTDAVADARKNKSRRSARASAGEACRLLRALVSKAFHM